MKISIVVPAYNEENYLPATLEKICAGLANVRCDSEMIVIDNESSDKTRLIAENSGAKVFTETKHNIAKVRNTSAIWCVSLAHRLPFVRLSLSSFAAARLLDLPTFRKPTETN